MSSHALTRLVPQLVRYRVAIAFLAHLAGAAAAYGLAWLVRFDGVVPDDYRGLALWALPLLLTIRGVCVYWRGLMRGMCRYFSIQDACSIVWVVVVSEAFFVACMAILPGRHFPRSVYILDAVFASLVYAGGRQFLKEIRPWVRRLVNGEVRTSPGRLSAGTSPTLIVGAGDLGEATLRLLQETVGARQEVVGFVDDDPAKAAVTIHGRRVLGTVADLPGLVARYGIRETIIAIGTPPPALVHRVVQACAGKGVKVRIVPTLRGLLSRELRAAPMREVAIEDLLGREPVVLDRKAVLENIQGRRILVTGAGGSIGSELARQVAQYQPSLLILLDNGESALFEIDRELQKLAPNVKRVAVVGDIRDAATVDRVFARTRPQRVFHAAAYKHVPLMEDHPVEAVWNNVHGTLLVAQAADTCGADSFLMISTDKAVRPANVMGATKRCAELAVVSMPRNHTTFVAVRFGNVLGSNGSVVPIFRKQIEEGGPVTVTHPEMTRYFMTIPEAVELVLQANVIGKPGDVFVLDMGEPVRIDDLARKMITLSGLVPDQDIKIVYTGLRPGEKLYEELVAYGEALQPTGVQRVSVLRQVNGVRRTDAIREDIRALLEVASRRDDEATRSKALGSGSCQRPGRPRARGGPVCLG